MLNEKIDNERKNAAVEPARGGTSNRFRASLKVKTRHASADLHSGGAQDNRILTAAQSYNALKPYLETVWLRAGEEISRAGERGEYAFFPETAVVSHLHNLADGNTIEVGMVGADGATGIAPLFGSHTAAAQTAVVIIGGRARRVETAILRRESARGGKLGALVSDYFGAYLAQVSRRVACTSFHSTEKRLCCWLLMLDDRARQNRLTLTQEQMAQFLGVQRPSLTKIAKNLSDERLVNYTRGNFQILDRRGLETAACECYTDAKISL